MRTIVVTIALIFTLTVPAYAYLDPGTGSIVLQAIIGGVAMVGATISVYWRKVRKFAASLFSGRKKEPTDSSEN
jgi:hypothetical protein